MRVGERIAERRACLDLSQTQLARLVGVSQPTIGKLEAGISSGSSHLHRIARVLKTTPAWLTGETDDPSEGYVPPPPIEDVAAELDLVPIRELDLSLGLGATFLDGDNPVEEEVQHFPAKWVRKFTFTPPDELIFAHTIGDSMQPTLFSGDIVLIDTRQNIVNQADLIWAFNFGGLGMIKRLGAGRDGMIRILSDNPTVPPESAAPDELRIIGRVVAIMRKM